jgi:predicted glutamine amidotransferase
VSHWLAWHGQPLLIEQLLFNPRGGLVDRARGSGESADASVGLGWYGTGDAPDVYNGTVAPWDDDALRELAGNVRASLFLAHVRAGSGDAIARHGRWLFVHDGAINGFEELKPDLLAAVNPSLTGSLDVSSPSEVLFALAVTFGLADDPVAGLERAIGFVEAIAVRRGVGSAVQASIGLSDGESVWAVRYCTRGPAPPLFASADVQAARMLYPNRPLVQLLKDDDHIVVSHPLADIPGAWDKLPEASAVVVRSGRSERLMFRPGQGTAAGEPIGS